MKIFRQYVLHNLGLKIISLFLAVGLWLAVARDPRAEVALEVPIELQNLPDKLQISSEHIPPAQIRVGGPERLISRLRSTDLHLSIDLAGVQPGERSFNLMPNQVHFPTGVEILQVVPSQLHLTFDTEATKRVAIHPHIAGNPPGYEVSRVLVVPPVISIVGPSKLVEQIEAATTDVVDTSANKDRATFTTHAYVSDPLIQIINPDLIHVTVIMQKSDTNAH